MCKVGEAMSSEVVGSNCEFSFYTLLHTPTHTHSWVDPLFWVGFRRTLNQSDLYAHPGEADSEKLLNRFNK